MSEIQIIATMSGIGNTHSATAIVGAVALRVIVAKVARSCTIEVRNARCPDRLEEEIVLAILLIMWRLPRQVTC